MIADQTQMDYQALCEELSRLSTRLEELGQNEEFTPELQEEWDEVDAAYQQALATGEYRGHHLEGHLAAGH